VSAQLVTLPYAAGLDSLGAVEYVNLVSRRLGVQLPSTLVREAPRHGRWGERGEDTKYIPGKRAYNSQQANFFGGRESPEGQQKGKSRPWAFLVGSSWMC
jgi:hypothetical protein